jgi:hypothetical protein
MYKTLRRGRTVIAKSPNEPGIVRLAALQAACQAHHNYAPRFPDAVLRETLHR